MLKFPKSSIYLRLVLTFVLIVAPLYAFSLKLNSSGEEAVKNEISGSLLAKVHFYLGLLELDIGKIVKQGREYFVDEDIEMLSVAAPVMPDFEKTKAMLRLQKQLLLLKISSSYIENVSVHITMLDRTISANGPIHQIPEDEFLALSVPSRQSSPFIVWNDRLFISYPYPEYALSDRPPSFLVEIEIDKNEMKRVLGQIFDHDKGEVLLIDDHLRWIMSSENNQKPPSVFTEWALDKMKNGIVNQAKTLEVGNKKYFVSYEYSSFLGAALMIYLPENAVMGPLDKHRTWFWLLSAISVIIIIFFSSIIYRLIHRPLRTLVRSFHAVERGDFNQTAQYYFKDEFSYLYSQFNAMVERLRVLIHEVYEQRFRAQASEFRQLQSQINPHFLYNSFYTLSRIAKDEDYEKVNRFTRYLGDYFRFITRDGADEVPLEEEWRFSKTYVEIQSYRFSSRIGVSFGDLPSGCGKLAVPRLILQPMIENAYNHGLANKKKDGTIVVKFVKQESTLLISVEDNGEELTDERLGELQIKLLPGQSVLETTGLVNIHRRIRIRFGDQSGLRLSRGELGGLKIEISIPLKERNEDVPTAGRG